MAAVVPFRLTEPVSQVRAKALHPSKTQSKYRGNNDTCPHCGTRYGDFKTGLSYDEVFIMLWTQSEDPSDWRYKKRRTVLGFWHGLKKKSWTEHIELCEAEKRFSIESELSADELDLAVPF